MLDKEKSDKTAACVVSDTYIKSNRKLFEGVDDPTRPEGPFNNCTRSLLVDSILNNLEVSYEFEKVTKLIKGLPNFLIGEYFEEAFLLHDPTCHKMFMKILDDFKAKHTGFSPSSIEYIEASFKNFVSDNQEDPRAFLQDNWASAKKMFKFQPLERIRDYFGEKNAIYFGFVGTLITALVVPALVGLVFFGLGLFFYYRYFLASGSLERIFNFYKSIFHAVKKK